MAGDVHGDQLRYLLNAGRVQAALEYLGLIFPYRFAALYRFDGVSLQNLVFVDREQPGASLAPTVPTDTSYCELVRASGESFLLEDSLVDPRVADHPKRDVVRSYCGVPLLDARGELFGTVCLFDYDAVPDDAQVLGLLGEIADALDPESVLASVAEGLDQRTNALEAMVDLIASASPDAASASEAFEQYAGPLREVAAARLSGPRRAAFDARLDALWHLVQARAGEDATAH